MPSGNLGRKIPTVLTSGVNQPGPPVGEELGPDGGDLVGGEVVRQVLQRLARQRTLAWGKKLTARLIEVDWLISKK